MKLRIFFLWAVAAILPLSVSARSIRQMWLAMPDSVLPYFNANLRQECVDFVDMKVKADVKNLLNGNSRMDTLSTDYLHLTLNESATLEMKMLPSPSGDSLLCLVKTLAAPEKESEIRFYDSAWHPLPLAGKLPVVKTEDFLSRPDTMSTSRFADLKTMVEPFMVGASLSPGDDSVALTLALPLVSSDEKTALRAITVQRKFKWNGESFK